MHDDGLPDAVILAVVAFVILLVGLSILSTVVGVSTNPSTTTTTERIQTAQTLDGSGQTYQLNSGTGTNETLYNSRGYAVNLTGAPDSYVESDSNIQIGDDANWTVATWAYVDDTATGNMTVLSVNGRVILGYNTTASNWTAWYYDDGSGNSYELTLDAPDQPSVFTHLTVVGNESHIKFYRNNSQSAIQNISQNSVVEAPVNSTNFDGRLEETRSFDDPLTDTERQALVDSPLGPQPDLNRTSRIMYDEPYEDNQLILFSSASLATSNVSYSSGFGGSEVASQNYTWTTDGPQLSVDPVTDYPVVYIDYTFTSGGLTIDTLTGPVGSAIVLAGLLPVIVILGVIIANLSGMRDAR